MKTYTKSELLSLSYKHPIIAFDGVCNLCDGFVSWLIKKDKKSQFRYLTLQSQSGQLLASAYDKETVLLAHQGVVYTYSDVGLNCMNILGGGWKVLSYISFLPKSFRDMIYHFISRNRYRWFGKKSDCMIPTPEVKEMFL